MREYKIGIFTMLYVFRLDERDKFEKMRKKYEGFCTERFINNELALEITVRQIKQ